jgi:Sec-independent protein translocase protein TatA
MWNDIFWCIVIYLLYRFIFELVVPIAKTVNKMKTTVSKMQDNQQQTTQQTQTNSNTKSQSSKGGTTNTNDEYIDFEEIKD